MDVHIIQPTRDVLQAPAPDRRLSSLLDLAWSATDQHLAHLAHCGDPARRRWHLARLETIRAIRGRVERRAFGKAVAA